LGYAFRIHAVKNIIEMFSVAPEISSRQGKAVGLKITRQHLHSEAVRLILYHAVNGAGQFVSIIELLQLAEMPRLLVAAQGVLNVMGNRRIYILVGGFAVGKG
jgi:hypothetical protein